MTVVMMFGGEARTGLAITPDGVELFETPDDSAERIGRTATALSRIAEGTTLLGDQAGADAVGTTATIAGTVLGEVRSVTPNLDERATVIYVDREAGVLVTPDGTAHALPVRAARNAGATLATLARGPTGKAVTARES